MYLPFDRDIAEFKLGLDRIDVLACSPDASDEELDRAIDVAVRLATYTDHMNKRKGGDNQ